MQDANVDYTCYRDNKFVKSRQRTSQKENYDMSYKPTQFP